MVRILANAHIGFGTEISGFTFMQTIWVQIKKDYKDTKWNGNGRSLTKVLVERQEICYLHFTSELYSGSQVKTHAFFALS